MYDAIIPTRLKNFRPLNKYFKKLVISIAYELLTVVDINNNRSAQKGGL